MKRIFTAWIVGLAITSSSLASVLNTAPAFAREVTGPRGGSASGNGAIIPNPQGGYTGAGHGTVSGPEGGTATGEVRFHTDGQGNGSYSGSGSVTTPTGESVSGTTTGSGSYNPTDGYSGSNSTTINGNTFNSTTQDGLTTVTGPEGNTQTFTPGTRRR